MIFTEIVLHNFGIYKGRHSVDLTPESADKPIILFGGLNGEGKTTFLDALQLTLYGKFSNCSNRGDLPYKDYLRQTINRYIDSIEGAGLELEFISFREGLRTTYRIKRFWRVTGKGINESMEVLKDNVLDPLMSTRWYDYVDEFIPGNISGLFFFDGEKIEKLANSKTSADIIRTGITSLLGLDLVDKLTDDLCTIERRRKIRNANEQDREAIKNLDNGIRVLEKERNQQNTVLARKISEIDSLDRQILDARKSYKSHGGLVYDQRQLIEEQRKNHEVQLDNINENIHKFSEGTAPLYLVKDLIGKALKRSKKEKTAGINSDISKTLEERDSKILKHFARKTSDKINLELLSKLFEDDRNSRSLSTQHKNLLNVRPDVLAFFDNQFFLKIKAEAKKLKNTYEIANEEMADSDQLLSAVPDEDMIREVAKKLSIAEDNKKAAQGSLETLQKLYDETISKLAAKQNELNRQLQIESDDQFHAKRNQRVLEHSRDARVTLENYRKALIMRHINRLEDLIMESFTTLVRKSDLAQNVRINADDFTLQITNNQGNTIPSEQLSAGERQLLAISILWGLAKSSGRPLPSIIDTPLGRLDKTHRKHLIKSYFPNVSHQLILLSTDTEIDAKYRDDLSERIGKEYRIQYDESRQTSTVSPGYF